MSNPTWSLLVISGHFEALMVIYLTFGLRSQFSTRQNKTYFLYSPDTFNLQTQIFPQIRSLSLPYFESAIFVPRKYPKVGFFRLCFHLFTACHNQLNPNHLTGDRSYFTSFTPCLTLFQTFC